MNLQATQYIDEVKLRGVYLVMSVDIEWILNFILVSIFKGKEDELELIPKAKTTKERTTFDRFTLFDKIEAMKIGLELYHKDFFDKHEQDLDFAGQLRDFRNKLAHSKIDWIGEHTIEFMSIKQHGLHYEQHSLDELHGHLKTFWQTTRRFLDLLQNFLEKETN